MNSRSNKRESLSEPLARAEQFLIESGGRATSTRCRVLAVLIDAEHALTHQEIARRLGKQATIDRVTLYRVLEWLVVSGLAHRISGDDRVWRFGFARRNVHHKHAHFNCHGCGQVFCLDDVSTTIAVSLPLGYQSQEVELTIKGLCEHCQ